MRVLAVADRADDVFLQLVARGPDAGLDVVPVLSRRDGLAGLARTADVVYAHQPKVHLYAAVAARRAGRPAWWACSGGPLDRAASLLPARGVVARSESAAAAQRRLPLSPPVVVLPPGVDTERFTPDVPPALAGDGPLVGAVEGSELFLRAAAEVAAVRPGTRFAVLGGCPEELPLLARGLGVDVAFPGPVEDLPAWLTACDVVVGPSREAMAAGRAVVDPGTGLAEVIAGLLDDDGLRLSAGRAARRIAEERHSIRAMCEGYAAAFAR